MAEFQVGDRVLFESTGSADGFPVEYAHSGAVGTVQRVIPDGEIDLAEVGPMYRVEFPDGVTISAFEDELVARDGKG